MTASSIQFGSGVLFGNPNAGNLVANPTPLTFGILQEVSVELKSDLKKLYGQNQFPVAVARGKIDISCKGKLAALDPAFFSQLYFGQPTTAGVQRPVYNEIDAPVSDVITPAHTPVTDLGVIVISPGTLTSVVAGQQLTKVSAAPSVSGTYEFTAGTYAFLAADITAGLTVAVSYTWNDSTHGTTMAVSNQLMGYAPQFTGILYSAFRGSMLAVQLNACILGTVSIPTKQEDFWIADFDMEAFADASNNVMSIFSDFA
jgi:hypothetical protein